MTIYLSILADNLNHIYIMTKMFRKCSCVQRANQQIQRNLSKTLFNEA